MQLLFAPFIFAVLHKMQAGNAGVTVAVMGMTWFFNQALLQYSMTLIAALRSYSRSGLFSPSSLILALFYILLSLLCSKWDLGHRKYSCFFTPFSQGTFLHQKTVYDVSFFSKTNFHLCVLSYVDSNQIIVRLY